MSNQKIKSVNAREIFNSRGEPTVEVDIITEAGLFRSAAPSGVSKGINEALELKDGGQRYGGKGVLRAIRNIKEIITPKIIGLNAHEQEKIDKLLIKLDGTENKSKLGANAIIAVSMAVCRAGAESQNLPLWKWISKISKTKSSLPFPFILFMEGGLHGRGNFSIQEIMAVFSAKSFKESFNKGKKAFRRLGVILKAEYRKESIQLGSEGAFTPAFKKTEDALELIMRAAGNEKIGIILDAASSTFFKNGKYYFEGKILSRKELLAFYSGICKKYPILAIEDPFSEEDWPGFSQIVKTLGRKIIIIGDDLTVTNIKRIKEAKMKSACNGIVLKPNQIGTVSEIIAASKLVKSYGWKMIVSHRGGETQDDFISDLAAGIGADFIKAGGPVKKERLVKYNRLLKIEENI
ncbi:MAG: enolase [Candidatus Parcubacteria bacterium]|nr:enolase [Candidatus Parcubacteria bacterium]